MSDDQPKVPTGRKHWLYLFAGFSLVATVAVTAAMLGVYFYLTRPLDLAAHTDYLADELEEALEKSFLPEDAIRLEETETRSGDGVTWDHYRYTVNVPEHLDIDGLKQLLRRAFIKHYVSVGEDTGSNGTPARVLRFTLGDYEFATVTLEGAPGAKDDLLDIRPEAVQLAKDVENAFIDLGLAADHVRGGDREERKDSAAHWALTTYAVTLPESVSISSLQGAVEARLSYPDASAYLARMSRRENVLNVAYAGKDVVTVTTVPTGDAPAEMLETMASEGEDTPDLGEKMAESLPGAEQLPLDSANAPDIPEGEAEEVAVTEEELPDQPRVAIILDDGGYGGPVTDAVLALNPALTLAILPNTPHGTRTAEAGNERGFEIMLHMPMETLSESVEPYPGQINTTMTREEITEGTVQALKQIPHVAGVNNHTGSKFTGDAMRMEIFLEVLKDRKLFFVDSYTQPDSLAWKVAQSLKVPSDRRDVFLDNEADPAAIRAQFEKLITLAKKRGEAIGIGHFRGATAETLKELLPLLEKEGVTLVHASELVS
jgi:hypothetical protein